MERNENAKLQTLAVLVDNESGVLSQVSRMFSRKGYNIESLVVGTTENPRVSRITIDVLADEQQITLLGKQLRKLLPVHSVQAPDAGNLHPAGTDAHQSSYQRRNPAQ